MRSAIMASVTFAATMACVPANAQALRDLQERYCTGDAFRLCSSEIPDETRITACMARLRNMLSPDCRAVFDQSEPEAQASSPRERSRRPMTLAPNY